MHTVCLWAIKRFVIPFLAVGLPLLSPKELEQWYFVQSTHEHATQHFKHETMCVAYSKTVTPATQVNAQKIVFFFGGICVFVAKSVIGGHIYFR